MPSAVRQDSSAGSWNTKPNWLTRRAAAAGSPRTSMRPEVGGMRSLTSRSSELLPHPVGPSSATNSPSATARLMSVSACTDWRSPSKRRLTRSSTMQGRCAGSAARRRGYEPQPGSFCLVAGSPCRRASAIYAARSTVPSCRPGRAKRDPGPPLTSRAPGSSSDARLGVRWDPAWLRSALGRRLTPHLPRNALLNTSSVLSAVSIRPSLRATSMVSRQRSSVCHPKPPASVSLLCQ